MTMRCLLHFLPMCLSDGGTQQQQQQQQQQQAGGRNSFDWTVWKRESIAVPDANIQGGTLTADVYRSAQVSGTSGMADAHTSHSFP
jgi:hypothetical protein